MRRGCDQWATDTTHLHEINDSSVSPHSTSLCPELMRWVFTMQCVMLLLLLYSLSAAAASRPRGDSIHRYCYAFKHLYNLHTFFFSDYETQILNIHGLIPAQIHNYHVVFISYVFIYWIYITSTFLKSDWSAVTQLSSRINKYLYYSNGPQQREKKCFLFSSDRWMGCLDRSQIARHFYSARANLPCSGDSYWKKRKEKNRMDPSQKRILHLTMPCRRVGPRGTVNGCRASPTPSTPPQTHLLTTLLVRAAKVVDIM